MKYIIALVLAVSFAITTYAQAPDAPLKDKSIKEQVEYWGNYYKIDSSMMMKVIKCESNFNKDCIAWNDGGKGKHSVGILQFQESTFLRYEKKLGEDLDYYSTYDQIKLASYMWSLGQQRQWTCYRMLN